MVALGTDTNDNVLKYRLNKEEGFLSSLFMSNPCRPSIIRTHSGFNFTTPPTINLKTIFVTLPPWEYDIEQSRTIFDAVKELFPNNNVMLKFDGITIESMMEDDLK